MLKRSLTRAAGLTASLIVAGAAQAGAVFSFSYTFSDSTVVTGNFTGDANGNLISNLSNISVFVNGNGFTANGNLFASHYLNNTWISGGGVASFDGKDNNFLFSDVDYPTNPNINHYLFLIPNGGQSWAKLETQVSLSDQSDVSSRWSVSQVSQSPASVPEPGSLLLVALSGLALGATRRRSTIA